MPNLMGAMDIAFPHLGIYLHNVPKTLQIGPFTIAMYGIMIATAMLVGLTLSAHMAKANGIAPDTIWDISIWLIVFAIVGARIYYVIFFFDAYKDNLLQIFNLRGGGLAIYGGIIADVIVIILYCRHKKVKTFCLLDTAAYGLLAGQIIGRWGNFFNREVFGGYTDSLFAMRLPVEMVRQRDITEQVAAHIADGTNYIQVHPTFLYEGLWNLGILIILLLVLKHKKFDGEITALYFLGYGIGRAWIEYIRTDQLYIGETHIPVSIVFSVIMIGVSLIFIFWNIRHLPAAQSVTAASSDGNAGAGDQDLEEKEAKDPDNKEDASNPIPSPTDPTDSADHPQNHDDKNSEVG
jgi:phosphatidylglycerol:prolipoprotein diacylglycerol transferase